MDRTYTAEDFTGYLSSIICNGVFDTYGDCFSVTAGTGTTVITYDGTLAQWQAIEKGSNWDGRSAMEAAQSGLVKIQCTDGYMEYTDGAWNEVKE